MLRIVLAIAAIFGASAAHAQTRCDCSLTVGQCRGEVKEVPTKQPGARFHIQADTEQCAVVEWSVDSDKGQTTVWDDGEEVSRVSPRKPGGKIEVQSCRICKDRLKGERAANGAAPTADRDASSFCAALASTLASCGIPLSTEPCDAHTRAELKAAASQGDADIQRQMKMLQNIETTAADFERIGMADKARDARASAERTRTRIKDLQCMVPKVKNLVND
jgi:hypothetical protein